MNNVTLETTPINLVTVEIDQSPILHEVLGAGTDGNRRGMYDVPLYTPLRFPSIPAPGD